MQDLHHAPSTTRSRLAGQHRPPGGYPGSVSTTLFGEGLAKLAFLMRHEEANPSWRDKLSAVGGIYLLTDRAHGRLYVGQAGGEAGI